jgi:hypothetical protein
MKVIQSLFLIVSSASEVESTPRRGMIELNLMVGVKIAKT